MKTSEGVLRPAAVVALCVIALLMLAGCTITTEQGGTTSSNVPGGTATTGGAVPGGGQSSLLAGVSPAEVVAGLLGPSVVNIKVEGSSPGAVGPQRFGGEGSGVVFRADGMIVTNNHVVSQDGVEASEITVTFATGEEAPGTLVGRDPLSDLAVIKVDKMGLPVAVFVRDMSEVRVGAWAVAIGSPLGFANSVTLGVVSGLQREIPIEEGGDQALVDLIQTDAAISPGNSGGALADVQGRVIGINVAYLPPGLTGAQDLGFAIPSDVAADIAEQLISTGRALHPYMGIIPQTVTPELQAQFGLSRSSGLIIADVEPNTPAAQAGLLQGDIIVSIDGTPMMHAGGLFSFLRTKNPGDSISVLVDREGAEVTIEVVLGERPPFS